MSIQAFIKTVRRKMSNSCSPNSSTVPLNVTNGTHVPKCTELHPGSILLIDVTKCMASLSVKHLIVTLRLAFVFGLFFRLGLGFLCMSP